MSRANPGKWSFDRNRAKTLKQVANERRRSTSVGNLVPEINNFRGCIVIFDYPIPAVYQDADSWVLGEGLGKVWKRDAQSDEFDPQDPDNAFGSADLVPSRDPNGRCERVRVFNSTPFEIPPCVPIPCHQDSHGDLYVYERAVDSDFNFYQTTTTTPIPADCTGNCKWVWDEVENVWLLDTDNCSQTTTTSTTTTTGNPHTSTTTTTEDCNCGSLDPYTTTTTTTLSCECQFPTHCGEVDGECTFTQCSPTYSGIHIECVSTTTCDCNTTTTTTVPPGVECSTCIYIGTPGGWMLSESGCSSQSFLNAQGDLCTCQCPPPGFPPAMQCDTLESDCEVVCIHIGCGGNCDWIWDTNTLTWRIVTENCSNSPDCVCSPPSEDGTICTIMSTPCGSTDPDAADDPSEHCGDCYSTTTSTTPPPENCPGDCKWTWNGTFWAITSNPCPPMCACAQPAVDGTDELCEVRWTPCFQLTTTTSTTTTTVNCNLSSGCLYESDGADVWTLVPGPPYECDIGCECRDPDELPFPCDVPAGYQYVWPCVSDSSPHPDCAPSPETGLYCNAAVDCPDPTTTTSTTTTTCIPAVCDGEPGFSSCFLRCTGGVWVTEPDPETPDCSECPAECACCGYDEVPQWVCVGDACTTEDEVKVFACLGPTVPTTTTTCDPNQWWCLGAELDPCEPEFTACTQLDPCEFPSGVEICGGPFIDEAACLESTPCLPASSTTTTTAAPPACGTCIWECVAGEWTVTDNCDPGCECDPGGPSGECSPDGDLFESDCVPV